MEVDAVLLTPPFEELAVHWLDPSRPALAEARAVVGTAATPAQAWDRVQAAGLLPDAWATGFHTMRGATVRHRYGNCRTPCLCDPGTVADRPARVHDVVVYAGDAEGIRHAEALAREGMARLHPWCLRPPADRLVWAVSRGSARMRGVHLNALNPVRGKVQRALDARDDRTFFDTLNQFTDVERAIRATGNPAFKRLHPLGLVDLIALSASWDRACALDLTVPGGFVYPVPAEGQRFAELPDPFAPWRAMWQTGYAPWAVTDEDGVLLAAPALRA
ncbi:hypothetical protein [Actinoplanes sp. ATCC 53533]|uniref:hypothetical protein n=1 Tax=Actinoplanes sp. ATCC 53533 TaxID=1288362 RepID=UPI000F773891|nr:hypothetical protein [Actinoplanes sp. ATCC 53533]